MAAAAGIQGAASLLGGISSKKGAKSAAKIQAKAYEQGIAEQNREFNTVQQNNAPYMAAGNTALSSLLTLLGLNGTSGQQSAIDALKASPLFTSQYKTGNDTILADAAATGGLRGGNTENSLADFGSQLLSSVIQNQIGNYGGLVGVGQAAASGTNAGALSTGANISNLLTQQGNSSAANTLGQSAITGQTINNIGKTLADYLSSNTGGGALDVGSLINGNNTTIDNLISNANSGLAF